MTTSYGHLYVLFFPQILETCFVWFSEYLWYRSYKAISLEYGYRHSHTEDDPEHSELVTSRTHSNLYVEIYCIFFFFFLLRSLDY